MGVHRFSNVCGRAQQHTDTEAEHTGYKGQVIERDLPFNNIYYTSVWRIRFPKKIPQMGNGALCLAQYASGQVIPFKTHMMYHNNMRVAILYSFPKLLIINVSKFDLPKPTYCYK